MDESENANGSGPTSPCCDATEPRTTGETKKIPGVDFNLWTSELSTKLATSNAPLIRAPSIFLPRLVQDPCC